MPTHELNCERMLCPLPIVKLSLKVRELASGELVRVRATDPAFRPDLDAWAEMTGHTIVEFRDGAVKEALLRVS